MAPHPVLDAVVRYGVGICVLYVLYEPHARCARDGGGGALKKAVIEAVNEHFAPIRARRAELLADPGYLRQVLAEGNARANEVADATLAEVQTALGMVYR